MFLNIANIMKTTTQFEFTGTGLKPHRDRILFYSINCGLSVM